MIAIVVVILTPIILSSTLLEKLGVMNRRMGNTLPSEQDEEIQHKIMEAISVQAALNERSEEIINSRVLMKSELEKQLAESPLVVQSNLAVRFVGLKSNISALQEEILNLRCQEEQIKQKVAELNLSGFNVAVLKQHGTRFEDQLSNGQYSEMH